MYEYNVALGTAKTLETRITWSCQAHISDY